MNLSITAGSPSDAYRQPPTLCKFNGASATNPPCMAQYSDPAMAPPTLVYGFNGISFSYAIPLDDGLYDIELTFVEPNKTAPGQRVFTVGVPGNQPLRIDIFAAVGLKTPYVVNFRSLQVTGGTLAISFTPIVGNAVISLIAIDRSEPTGAIFGGHT